jgi:hypothetical protein
MVDLTAQQSKGRMVRYGYTVTFYHRAGPHLDGYVQNFLDLNVRGVYD